MTTESIARQKWETACLEHEKSVHDLGVAQKRYMRTKDERDKAFTELRRCTEVQVAGKKSIRVECVELGNAPNT